MAEISDEQVEAARTIIANGIRPSLINRKVMVAIPDSVVRAALEAALLPRPVEAGVPEGWTDWIEWNGGDRPHPPATKIEVKFRDGRIEQGVSAFARWWHELDKDDVVAYRLPTPPATGDVGC